MYLRLLLLAVLLGAPGFVSAGKEKESAPVRLVDLKHLDRAPSIVHQVAPVYPPELLERGVTGDALIAFIIEADGTVSNAYALKATDPKFGEAGVAAIMQWRFQPPMSKKRSVRVRLQVPLGFGR